MSLLPMAWVKRAGVVWAGVLISAVVAFVGCSRSASGNSCLYYCDNLCSSLQACDLEEEDCRSNCEAELTDDACKSQPTPDRLTCAELTQTVACAQYCTTLCNRAPTCGTFNANDCLVGCLEVEPSVCNPASVNARTCDQLKPELRFYESRGTPSGGDSASGVGDGTSFGLCTGADDCEALLGCSRQTNTCAPCKTNEDCAAPNGSYVCNDEQECEAVECVVDDDCSLGRPCSPQTHECGECRGDEDCGSLLRGACDPTTLKCVDCNDDSDCRGALFSACDVELQKCVECLADSDCHFAVEPPCDVARRTCVECNEDAHCPEDSPRCDAPLHLCRGCFTNEDCPEARPHCHPSMFCEWCLADEDCEGREKPFCTDSGACGACKHDEGCEAGQTCDLWDGTCVPPQEP